MPPPERPDDDAEPGSPRWLLSQLRHIISDEVVPQLQRHQDEVIEARIADFAGHGAPDVQALTRDVAGILGPAISRDVQAVVDTVSARISAIEARIATAPGVVASQASVPASQPELVGDRLFNAVGMVDKILDIVAERALPLIERYQSLRQTSARDVSWAASLRAHDPIMAATLAGVLNPDPLINHLPELQYNAAVGAFQQGMRIRQLASVATAPQGGQPWPATPGMPQPGGSRGPSGVNATPSSGPGAQMAGRRRATRNAGNARVDYETRPTRADSAPGRLVDLVGQGL